MGVTVVIPWQSNGDPHRARALTWLARRFVERPFGYALTIPTLELHEQWSKPRAILEGARAAHGDIVVVHDADVWCEALPEAIEAVRAGAPWAIPHYRVHRLTPESTEVVLAGHEPDEGMPTVKRPYRGVGGGGIVVLPLDTLRAIPPDVRFVDWGGEDGAWRDALRCLAGPEWRESRAPLFHLWHPPALDARGVHEAPEANGLLAARYNSARHRPDVMRALIAEAGSVEGARAR